MGSIRSFKRKYGIELLMASEETLRVGLEAKYNRPILELGLEIRPYYVTDRLELPSVDETKYEGLFDQIAKATKVKAEIADYSLESTFDFGAAFKMPSLGIDISADFDYNKIQSFSYDGVMARVTSLEVGRPLVKQLAQIKSKDGKWWRKIDGFHFVEKLYYADKVVITSDSKYAAEIAAKLQMTYNIEVGVKVSGTNKSRIEFSGAPEAPFATKIEVIRDFVK